MIPYLIFPERLDIVANRLLRFWLLQMIVEVVIALANS
jgi:hypothetical protein